MYSLTDYNYHLPDDRIAQKPSARRDRSKLLFLNQKTGGLSHHRFYELNDLLSPEDILVLNNTEVIPGRLTGYKDTGGKVELLILNYADTHRPGMASGETVFQCLIKTSKKPKPGTSFTFDEGLRGTVIDCQDDTCRVRFIHGGNFEALLYCIGKVPLPPYIKRENNDVACDDRTSYQTVYATQKGAVAAPTAGLHFTEDLIVKLKKSGVGVASITLHVGYGTFSPIRAQDIRNHRMHPEWFNISKETADTINLAKANKQRVIAVGTTCVRALEYASDKRGTIRSGNGQCDLFIYPGYRFRAVDGMITNFHLPRSTLLMLVYAFAGREKVLNAYNAAVHQEYRFYSYGDAMLIA
ncbi:tRNA preQ1(34) S-adenosylmethionine ribosyltransferase-isomerase QueA [Thermodesulfobacteriota bacterium]